jgi:hypothetical protein
MIQQEVALEVLRLAKSVGWQLDEMHMASTGSIYIELVRQKREWVCIRVADHKQVYHGWMTTYSIAPGNLWFEDLKEILSRPFGTVGDVLL